MKYLPLFLIISAISLFALKEYEYARIVTDEKGMQAVKAEGYDILREGFTKKGNEYSFEIYVDEEGIGKLRQMGFDPEVRIDNRTAKERTKGYRTNDQIGQELDSLQTVYPDICERLRIGSSVEERPLWALRIFDKNSSRDLRPEFKYNINFSLQ
ncbi:MAG: M14 family zinc carboxypeptidase [Candidatus Delongbacteria bacterium]